MRSLTRNPYLLYSYLATEMLAPFFASFLVMNGVFFLVKLIPFLNFALDLGIGFADFIRLFSYMLPNMLLYTIPMSSMMGVIICFSRLSNDTEILALKASGVSIYRLLPPVIIISTIIAVSTCYISVKLIPKSDQSMKQLTYQLLKEKVDRGIKEQQFTEALGELVLYVDQIDNETGEWKDVWVSDMRGQINPTITMASRGQMIGDMSQMNVTIMLRNGSLHRPDGDNAQIVNFEKYVINIPLKFPNTALSKKRSTLTLPELVAASEKYGLDNERGRDMLVEYHKRLVLPVGCLVLSVLGLPLGLLAGPGKKAIGIPIGLAIFIIYYIVYSTFKNMAEDGVAPIFFLMWLPNTAFMFIAIYSVKRVSSELPILSEDFQYKIKQAYECYIQLIFTGLSNLFSQLFKYLNWKNDKLAYSIENDPASLSANSNNFEYHLPSCAEHSSPSCTISFDSVDQAEEAGFKPCASCKELLENSLEISVE